MTCFSKASHIFIYFDAMQNKIYKLLSITFKIKL